MRALRTASGRRGAANVSIDAEALTLFRASLPRTRKAAMTTTTRMIGHRNTEGWCPQAGLYPAATHSGGAGAPTLNLTSSGSSPPSGSHDLPRKPRSTGPPGSGHARRLPGEDFHRSDLQPGGRARRIDQGRDPRRGTACVFHVQGSHRVAVSGEAEPRMHISGSTFPRGQSPPVARNSSIQTADTSLPSGVAVVMRISPARVTTVPADTD